jgi:hypothetical protein
MFCKVDDSCSVVPLKIPDMTGIATREMALSEDQDSDTIRNHLLSTISGGRQQWSNEVKIYVKAEDELVPVSAGQV